MRRFLAMTFILLLTGTGTLFAASGGEKTPPAKVDLVGMDYPDYVETIGALTLPDTTPAVVAATDSQYLRLSLVDVEDVPYLPQGFVIYQTVSTGAEIPVNLNFIVDEDENAWCFNPEVPYCTDFARLNEWLKKAGIKVKTEKEAGPLARYVIALGMSTAHMPRDFLFMRLSGKFGVEQFEFIKDIEQIYEASKANYRSEEEAAEYATMSQRYGDRLETASLTKKGNGWIFHGFTYKRMKAAGDLREWQVHVHPNGTVDVEMTTLEEGIGEVTWPWAQ